VCADAGEIVPSAKRSISSPVNKTDQMPKLAPRCVRVIELDQVPAGATEGNGGGHAADRPPASQAFNRLFPVKLHK
jgi:hypothetical protein